ncbi:hypothetical protein ABIA30_004385 [Mycobacterium sp. MAA66]|uniref:hypothetical protein n=1 Tax=Mycobacterium sp. MAA66 TaxID=3156297 RepID=UPI003511E7A7
MSHRAKITAAALAALLLAGCSGNKYPTAPSSTPPDTASPSQAPTPAQTAPTDAASPPSISATRPAPPPPPGPGQLSGGDCLKLTGATLNLVSGANSDDNRKAADTIESFSPPDNVREAVEHFVSTGGLKQTDPKKNDYSKTINNWVEKVCPV